MVLASLLAAAASAASPAYVAAGAVPLGAPDRWDYVVVDRNSGRVYVAHGDRVTVVDGRKGAVIGNVEGITGGTHGTGLSPGTNQGFTDDGRNGVAIVFDLKTLKVLKQIPAAKDADAVAADKTTGDIFVVEGDPKTISVIDPKTDASIATIQVGEGLEYAASDNRGALFVAGAEKGDLIKVDTRAHAVVARWSTPDCASPHGLAYDSATRRVFVGCLNSKMMVVDAGTGKVVAEMPIGRGNDAVAFDPVRKRVFSSNGVDGTISVFQQQSADRYEALPPVTTAVSGRTMDVDPKTGRLFVAAAETDPPASPGARARPRAGTLKLLMFDLAP